VLNNQGKAVHGGSIHILGIAYKHKIDDMRESPHIAKCAVVGGEGRLLRHHY